MEEEVSTNEEKILTTRYKTSKSKHTDKSPLVEISRLNSTIWRSPQPLQAGDNPGTGGKEQAARPVQALDRPGHEDRGKGGLGTLQNSEASETKDLVAKKKTKVDVLVNKDALARKRTRESSSDKPPSTPSLSPAAVSPVPARRTPLLRPKVQGPGPSPTSKLGDPAPPVTAEKESPTPAKRGRGRPPKKVPDPSGTGSGSSGSVPKVRGSSPDAENSNGDQEREAVVPPAVESPVVLDSPVTVKRGRGRPPKYKKDAPNVPAEDVSITEGTGRASTGGAGDALPGGSLTRGNQAIRSPVSRTRGSPVRVSHPGESPARKTGSCPATPVAVSPVSKPVTRGALGKGFPSAKRKSWADYLM